jgi:hypothetical protein
MDAESLVKELILKSMTPEQQQAILDSVKNSVAQARAVQKQKIGENVDLVVQALKKIESDIRSRYDDLGNLIEKRVASIQDGRDGINGTDGRDGRDGKPGKDGAPGRQGAQGPAGKDGIDGVDGVSVTNAYLDFDGGLVITLSNGNEINVGEIMPMELASQIKVITNGGGTSQYVLDTLASLQTQINSLIPSQTGNSGKFLTTDGTNLSWGTIASGLSYQGTWNASTNTPTLASGVGTNGHYYIVATAGSTNLDGITDWQIGDWLIFNGTNWQKIDQTNLVTSVNGQTGVVTLTYTDVNAIGSITSTDGSVTVSTTSGVADLSVAVAASTTNVVALVRNTTGATLTKGTVVYITGATGQISTVSKAIATGDSTSAQTLGVMSANLANNSNGYVTIIGLVTGMDTSAYTDGQQLYLSPTTAGTYTATKPYAPDHMVYVAIVEHAHPTHGKLFVKVQNGYELDELHDVAAQSPSNGQTIVYNSTTSLWEKNTVSLTVGVNGTLPVANGGTGQTSYTDGQLLIGNTSGNTLTKATLTAGTGISITNGNGSISIAATNSGTVTSVTGSSPVVSSGGATPDISLASGYGDTQNPYASKTANYVLAAPNGSSGAPTFRAIVAADIPTLNQNTTGTASNVTGIVAVANGGTGTDTPSLVAGSNITVSGTWPNQTIAATSSGSGTVTSVAASVPSFLSISGSPITTSGTLAISYSGTALPIANGGTGITSTPTDGQLLIGNGTGYTASTLTAGSNITITNSSGGITIASSGGGGTLVFPFYKADGASDTISLVSGTALPFFNSSGTAKNIALTT